jgi:5-methylcytosine-specific restriction endonuclease McrA
MRKHTQTYLDGMGFDETDFICCEVCGAEGKDIHHLVARGMGGTKKEYTVEELMCLCRTCHIKYGDKKQHMEMLKEVHEKAMKSNYVQL